MPYVAEAFSAAGTPKITYDALIEMFAHAVANGFVVRTVEAWEFTDDAEWFRTDASFHFTRSDAWGDLATEVQRSVDFANEFLSSVSDRADLRYCMWYDGGSV